MREKLIIEPGQTVQVSLDKEDGRPVESRTGKTEYMRVVDHDERIIFAPLELETAIKASGANAGDVIQITRRGKTAWDVAIVQEDPRYARNPEHYRPTRPKNIVTLPAVAQVAPAPTPAREITADAAEMTSAFVAAIEASQAAEQYAEGVGLRDFRLNTDAIRALAVTIYIQRAKGGRN